MYVNVGEGSDPVLMIHGAGVSGWMWRPLRELLGPAMKAMVPDLPGFGRRAAEPYISHEATVQGLTGVIERFAPQGAHVVGFSVFDGGSIEQRLPPWNEHVAGVTSKGCGRPVRLPSGTGGCASGYGYDCLCRQRDDSIPS